jgi:hypothetical protein
MMTDQAQTPGLELNSNGALNNDNQAKLENGGALSKSDCYAFLKGSECAEIRSPLEEARGQVESFAMYTTGTLAMKYTPELMDSVSQLRQMSVSVEFKKLAMFIQALQHDLPLHNGLLSVMLNPAALATHVPFCETPEDVTDEMKQFAKWNIEHQGDYALIDGVPVWDRLEGERVDFYNLFKLYRDARYGLLDSGDYTLLNRSMAGLATRLNLAPLLLSTLSNIYNWQLRCAYYDRFFEMEILRRRQTEIQLLQRDHLKFSTTLMDKAMSYLEKNASQLSPKEAIAMLDLGFKVSRLSLGMLPDKPGMPGDPQAQPLLAINVNQKQDTKIQVNNDNRKNFSSDVERQLHEDLKDTDNLLSILHVLQKSGAMATAIQGELVATENIQDVEEVIVIEEAAQPVRATTAETFIIPPAEKVPSAFREGII